MAHRGAYLLQEKKNLSFNAVMRHTIFFGETQQNLVSDTTVLLSVATDKTDESDTNV